MSLKVAVVGGGPGGYMAAIRASQLGAQVTLVEKDRLGGTCLHWGCIPTKTMKATCHILDGLFRAKEMGVALQGIPRVDLEALMERKKKVVEIQEKGIALLLKRYGVKHIQGKGRITSPGLIEVQSRDGAKATLEWDRLIVATGSKPSSLPQLPFDGKRILSSSHFLELRDLPGKVLVLGGGVVGCETACMLRSMGVEVYLAEALNRLLPMPSFDPDMARALERELKKKGINIYLGKTVVDLLMKEDRLEVVLGPYSSQGEDAGDEDKRTALAVEKIIVAVGRAPATRGLGLEAIGVETDSKGWIQGDEFLQTTSPGVFAVGDVLGPRRPMLAHVAYKEGALAAENAMGQERKANYDIVPCAVFTSPEAGFVGLSQTQAMERGIQALSETFLLRLLGKAQTSGEIGGQLKVVFDKENHRILGFQLVGAHSTELLWGCALAVAQRATLEDLSQLLFPHPTFSEAIGEVVCKALGRPLHDTH